MRQPNFTLLTEPTRTLTALLLIAFGCLQTFPAYGQITLSEIRVDQPSTDTNEFVELKGPPGIIATTGNIHLVVLGDGTGASGVIEEIVDLSPLTIGPSGYAVVAETSFNLGSADLTVPLNFENGDTLTFMLVTDLTGALGEDLDVDDDGTLDSTPWNEILDSVSIISPSSEEFPYSEQQVSDSGNGTPGHIHFCAVTGFWEIANFNDELAGDTPGAANACSCPTGFYGETCASECPGTAANACSGNGQCDEGVLGTGQCDCNDGFVGDACDQCGPGRFGPTCAICPGGLTNLCSGNGVCNDGISGTGECVCEVGFGGTACGECQSGYFGSTCVECPGGSVTPCNGNGVCADGLTGTGDCICAPPFAGSDCSLPGVSLSTTLFAPNHAALQESVTITAILSVELDAPSVANAVLTIQLPTGLTYNSNDQGCALAGQVLTCNTGALTGGSSYSVMLDTTVSTVASVGTSIGVQADVSGAFVVVSGTANAEVSIPIVVDEDCANGVDDDGFEGADCQDPACTGDAFCSACNQDYDFSSGGAGWTTPGTLWQYAQILSDGLWATGGSTGLPAGPQTGRLDASLNVPGVAAGGPAPTLEVVYVLEGNNSDFSVCVNQTICSPSTANGFTTSQTTIPGTAPEGAASYNDGIYDHIFIDVSAFVGQTISLSFVFSTLGDAGQNGLRITQVLMASDVDFDGQQEGADSSCDPCWDGDFDGYNHPFSPGLGTTCAEPLPDCNDSAFDTSPGAVEICNKPGDEDCDTLVNGFDPDCGPEDCANGVDDNTDDNADCSDPLCTTDPACGVCGLQYTFDTGPAGLSPDDNNPNGDAATFVWQYGQNDALGGVLGWSTGRNITIENLNTENLPSVRATLTREFTVPTGLPAPELEIVYSLDGDGGPTTDVLGICFNAQAAQCNASAPPNLLAWTTTENTNGLSSVQIPLPASVSAGGSLTVVLFYDTVDTNDNANTGVFLDSISIRSDIDQDGLYERFGEPTCDNCVDKDADGFPANLPYAELTQGCDFVEFDCNDESNATNPGVEENCALPGDQNCNGLADLDEETCSVCGDGIISAGEQCDDSNVSANDGCDPACQFEPNALLFTEIHMSVLNGEAGEQWIELKNRTDSPLDLSRSELTIHISGTPINLATDCVATSSTFPGDSFLVLALGAPSETDGLNYDLACPGVTTLSEVGEAFELAAGDTIIDTLNTSAFACALNNATKQGVGRSLMLEGTVSVDSGDNDSASSWCLPDLSQSYSNSGNHYGSPGTLGQCGEAYCDLTDDDCDGLTDNELSDIDSDGYCDEVDCDNDAPSCALDCTTDNDVDGIPDCRDGCLDVDNDGYGLPGGLPENLCVSEGGLAQTDCNDNIDFVNPGASEGPENGGCSNGLDEDCDGLPDCTDTACQGTLECESESCSGITTLSCGDVSVFEPVTNAFPCGDGADVAFRLSPEVDLDVELEIESTGTAQYGIFALASECVDLACDASASSLSTCADIAVLPVSAQTGSSYDFVIDAIGTCAGVGSAPAKLTVRCSEQCSSGIDEDVDGLTDCNDSDCVTSDDCANQDFDQDGATNSEELVCSSNPTDPLVFPSGDDIFDLDNDELLNCVDDDDDGDGIADTQEIAQCLLNPNAKNVAIIGPGFAKNCELAEVDADCNGYYDTAEDACGALEVQCIDGEDNDSDNLTDCADPDCVPTTFCTLADFDGDEINNGIEILCNYDPYDSTSTPTAQEVGDLDDDALPNCYDTDDDGDGAPDVEELICGSDPLASGSVPQDTDSDGQCNATDQDDDNDGYLDIVETDCNSDTLDPMSNPTDAAHDTDSDGVCDPLDSDLDGDGWDNTLEDTCGTSLFDGTQSPTTAGLDGDNDLVCDALDSDDDNDGWEDDQEILCLTNPQSATSVPTDTDGDGICDLFDEDTDGDGWPDELETQCETSPTDSDDNPTANGEDIDSDFLCNKLDADDDGDLWTDEAEEACGTAPFDSSDTPIDTDSDQLCDPLDDDDDNDSFSDTLEEFCLSDSKSVEDTPTDADSDGLCDANDPDADFDGDGWTNSEEQGCGTDSGAPEDIPTDTDNDGTCDPLDPDSDGDSWNDAVELDCGSDPLSAVDVPLDSDNNGLCNGIDSDDDGDGAPDADEILCSTNPLDSSEKPTEIQLTDTDSDGSVNCIDTDDDGDGLVDTLEEQHGSNPLIQDTDGDGLSDGEEDSNLNGVIDETETSPTMKDTDGDLLDDGIEAFSCYIGSPPDTCQQTFGFDGDTDADGIPDGIEDANKDGFTSTNETNPLLADSDNDGVNDGEEVLCQSDPLDPDATPEDLDTDGVCDGAQKDTDADEVPDGVEALCGTDPLDSSSAPELSELTDSDSDGLIDCADTDDDGDGIDDSVEIDCQTDPNDSDSTPSSTDVLDTDLDTILDCLDEDDDDDGLSDKIEEELGTDPLDQDTDNDGLSDGQEATLTATDPTNPDTDGDGLQDGTELGVTEGTKDTDDTFIPDEDPASLTNPVLADTDGDNVSDGEEDNNNNGRVDPGELDPNLMADGLQDLDNDGLTDLREKKLGTNPLDADSDNDQLSDKLEVDVWDTDPLNPDSDGGGVEDGIEVKRGTDPLQNHDDYRLADVSGDTVFGCSETPAGQESPVSLILVFGLLLLGLRRRSCAAHIVLILSVTFPPHADAQDTGVNVENFQPGSGRYKVFSVEESLSSPAWQPYAHMMFYGERQSLRVRAGRFDEVLIESQTLMDLNIGIGLWNVLQLDLSLPVALQLDASDSVSVPPQSGAGLGDMLLRLRGTVVDNRAGGLGFAIAAGATLPIGEPAKYRGEPNSNVLLNTITDYRFSSVVVALNIGFRFRTEEARILTAEFSHELTYGLGANITLWPNYVQLGLEVFGRTPLSQPFQSVDTTTLELHAGPRIWLWQDLALQLGAGAGLVRGYGSPQFRFSAGLAWAPRHMDADGDGIPDSSDLCTLEPEDLDGTMDEDGCPELDNDGDGINDADDLCPTIAEDINGVDDDDGCPDSDRDGDGIADIKDKCPLDPEDIDKFEDTDGCPDLDADRDGIPDARDQCPALAETYNEIDDTDGCPESTTDNVATVPPKITTMHTLCEVRWSDIHFAKDDASLTAEARSQLQKLSTLLKDKDHKPAILHVLISGHASAEGTDKHNYRLSKQRARVTYRYLRELGVSAAKISERALGESAPANDHPNKNGLFENRRVSFQFELSGRCDR